MKQVIFFSTVFNTEFYQTPVCEHHIIPVIAIITLDLCDDNDNDDSDKKKNPHHHYQQYILY